MNVTTVEPAPVAVHPLPSSIRTLWRVSSAFVAALGLVAAAVAGFVADAGGLAAVLAAAVLVAFAVRWAVIELRYTHWRWGIDDRVVERRSGAIVRRTHVVPRSRVQAITTRTGPLDRYLGLSAIVIHTAGTHTPNLVIPHLEADTVEHLRAELGG